MNRVNGKIALVAIAGAAIGVMMIPLVGGAYLVNLDRLMERGGGPLPSHMPASSNVKREGK